MDEMMAEQTILCALDEIEAEVTSWRHFFANAMLALHSGCGNVIGAACLNFGRAYGDS